MVAFHDGMKILYIAVARIPTEKAHGLQIMKTCEALADLGASVQLLVPRRPNALKDDPFAYYKVRKNFSIRYIFSFGAPLGERLDFLFRYFSFAFAAACSSLVRESDVLYGRDEIALAVIALLRGRRVVWESHQGNWNMAARFIAHRIQLLVVISQGLKDFYVSKGIPAERIVVAHDAVDIEEFSVHADEKTVRARLGLPTDKKIAMYIGKLDEWKGAGTFARTASLLPEVCVALIGGAPDVVARMKAQYGDALYLGFRPYRELPDNQAAADVLVLPNSGATEISARFTSPLKLFTYMMSGKPIVASDLPSIREVLDETNAYLVKPDDEAALAAGIRKALADPNASVRAKAAREKVESYSWKGRAEIILTTITGRA